MSNSLTTVCRFDACY